MNRSPGTWRRLKILSELRVGHGLPRLPEAELLRMLGILVAISKKVADEALGDDAMQERLGREAKASARAEETLEAMVREWARRVDARPFL